MSPVRVGINGFGRIGRNLIRAAHESRNELEFVAVNDIADPTTLAHLLKYDSMYGRFAGEVEAREGAIRIDGREVAGPGREGPGGASLGGSGSGGRDRIDRAVPKAR